MKLVKSFSTFGLFFLALAACNDNQKNNNTESAISQSDSSSLKKDSALTTNDTLTNPTGVNGGATKNNPDITK